MYKFKGYDIFISDVPNKKYYAIVNNKKIYFGSLPYTHYYDVIGYYSHLNTLDKKRRELYYKRHNYQSKKGSRGWFSKQILWPKSI